MYLLLWGVSFGNCTKPILGLVDAWHAFKCYVIFTQTPGVCQMWICYIYVKKYLFNPKQGTKYCIEELLVLFLLRGLHKTICITKNVTYQTVCILGH